MSLLGLRNSNCFNKVFIGFYLLIVALTTSSCATMYSGTKSILHINSNPDSAEVYLNDKLVGTTPINLKVKKQYTKQEIRIHKDGYFDSTFVIKKSFNKVSLLSNVVIYIDLLTGAVLKHKAKYYNVELKPNNDSVKVSSTFKTPFYIVKFDGDTVFIAPYLDNHNKHKELVLDFETIQGNKESISQNLVKKVHSQELRRSVIWLPFLSPFLYIQTGIDVYYVNNLSYFFSNTPKLRYGVLMTELLENGKYHLVCSYFDDNSVYDDDGYMAKNDITYYLYEDGKSVFKVSERNLYNILLLYFPNENELISEQSKKASFKKLRKYLKKHRNKRNLN